jgi:hypothetical protein
MQGEGLALRVHCLEEGFTNGEQGKAEEIQLTMITIDEPVPCPSSITARSTFSDQFRPTPVPKWLVLALLPSYEAVLRSAARKSTISCSRVERGWGAATCRR